MKREMFLCLTFAKYFSYTTNTLIYSKKQFIFCIVSCILFYLYNSQFKPYQTFSLINSYLIIFIFKPNNPKYYMNNIKIN